MKNLLKISSLALLFFAVLQSAKAQKVDDFLKKYTGNQENAIGYTQPIADVLGASLNSGLFHTAYINPMKFHLYVGIVGTTAMIPTENQTYSAFSEFSGKHVTAPTIFGSSAGAVDVGAAGTKSYLPGGVPVQSVPLVMPQITIGSVYGTNLTLRFMGFDLGKNLGALSYFGFGINHSLSQYFKYIKAIETLPVDVAIGFYSQSFEVEKFVKTSAQIFSLQASYQKSIFTFYGGLGFENSKTDLNYVITPETSFKANLKAQNSVRLTTGVTLNLGSFKLNVDYNFAKQSVISFGIGIGIHESKPKTVVLEETKTVDNKTVDSKK